MCMRKLLVGLVLLIFLLGTGACAQQETLLPQGVLDLCARVHPGYEAVRYDGWGDEECGQFALILKNGEDNILCMAEKSWVEAVYRLTIDNTDAVYDGDVLPSVMIDTGGDSLWYTYVDARGDSSVHYCSIKSDGRWGCVSVHSYWPRDDGFTGMWAGVSAVNSTLCYEETDEDENENIRNRWAYMPVWVGPEYMQSLELAHFDINVFDNDPRDGLYPLIKNEAFARSQSAAGVMIRDMDISRVYAARLFETEDGASLLQVDDWDGTFSHTAVMLRFTDGAVMDTYHAGAGDVFVSSGMMMYSIERADVGSWYLTGVDDSGVRMIGPDYVSEDGQTIMYRNDGFVYGASPWAALRGQDVMISSSYEGMAAQLNLSAYALVSNPNPADRLHLRAAPDKGAKSYGKFFNRTPVLVLERGETWTRVQIGRGGAAMTGYMMTKFLAFGEAEKAAIECTFPQKVLKDAYRLDGVHLYAEPRDTAVTNRIYKRESDDFIIGVSGDEWYVVLRADGAVGYVPQDAFWEGNG